LKAKAAEEAEERKKTTSTANWANAEGKTPPKNAKNNKNAKTQPAGEKSLEEHTVEELKEIAHKEGADITGLSRKDDIIGAIEDNRSAK